MPGLVSLACAAKEALECRDLLCTEVARLRDKLEQGIIKVYPKAQVCFKDQERLPHCSTIVFPGILNESLLYLLNRRAVYASIGGGSFQQLGLLLQACGVEEHLAQCGVAFTLSRYTTDEEIDHAIDVINECNPNPMSNLHKFIMTLQALTQPFTWSRYSKKLMAKIDKPRCSGFFNQEQADERGVRLASGQGGELGRW